jgi:hypothetical protein
VEQIRLLSTTLLVEQEGAVVAPVVATLEQIRQLRKDAPRAPQGFQKNNIALKWLRDSNEDPPGNPRCDRVDITDNDPILIGVLAPKKKGDGPKYTFVENERQEFSWRSMLAGFPDPILEQVVGCGVVQITCEPLVNSYSHSQHHATEEGQGRALEGKAPIWDFVVTREDGTKVRFHPEYTKSKIQVTPMSAAPPSLPPRAGLGKSDGRGTFKGYKQASYAGVGGGITSCVQPLDTVLHQPAVAAMQSECAAWQSQRAPPRPRVGGAPGTAGAAANSGAPGTVAALALAGPKQQQHHHQQQVPPAQHDGSGRGWWQEGWGDGSWGASGWWWNNDSGGRP